MDFDVSILLLYRFCKQLGHSHWLPILSLPAFFAASADSDNLDAGISDAEQYHAYSELTQLQRPHSKDHWDDMCSTTTPCSQTSEEEAKMPSPTKNESFTNGEKAKYAPAVVNLVPDAIDVDKLVTDDSLSYAGTGNWGRRLGKL